MVFFVGFFIVAGVYFIYKLFTDCHFRIWVDSDLSLSLIQVDSGLTLLLVKVDFRPYPCFWLFPQVLSRSGVDWRA